MPEELGEGELNNEEEAEDHDEEEEVEEGEEEGFWIADHWEELVAEEEENRT